MKLKNKTWQFLQVIRVGERYGYPRCCCIEFASDFIAGRNSAELRGLKKVKVVQYFDHTGTYVPCSVCKDKP